jgi:peptidoglycan-N-acetylglucosamine deacetylase
MIPHRVPFFIPLLYPTLLWRMPAEENKTLYLTFDDGPVPGPTEFVLDELEKFGIKATFFCIGDNIRKHPEIFLRIINAGHRVGNHTFNHLNGWSSDNGTYLENIQKFEDMATERGSTSSLLFRPPYGRIKRSQISSLNQFKIVMWDVLSFDFNKKLTADLCLRKTIEATRNGSIIVFHDSVKAEKNMYYALPRFIDHFLHQGFTFDLLS